MRLHRLKTKRNFLIICITITLTTAIGQVYAAQKNKLNVIILLLDCVRADHLGCYGYYRDTSPHIDALASQGTKFNKAISQAPWTLPSVVSLLSGCYPHRHGAGLTSKEGRSLQNDYNKLQMPGSDTLLLPELLQQNGYQTWGFSTNAYIDNRSIGNRGFVDFQYLLKAPAEKVIDYGIEQIMLAKESKRPFFLYLHFMDAHQPLYPPEKYYNFFPTNDGKNNTEIHGRWEFQNYERQQGTEFENYKEHKISLYDGTIRYMDAEIGRLTKFLKSSNLMSRTIVLVLSDHGEEFWEHADFAAAHYQDPRKVYGIDHGHTMFQELLWVPLIVTNLNSKRGLLTIFKKHQKEVREMVQLIDITPTLLEKIGFQNIPACDGKSLSSLVNRWRLPRFLSRSNLSSRSIFSESPAYGNLKIALLEFPYKCIYSYKEKTALFNLEEDPQERENLFEEHLEIASDMLNKIHLIENEKPGQTEKLSLSEEDLEALRSLGYIQ